MIRPLAEKYPSPRSPDPSQNFGPQYIALPDENERLVALAVRLSMTDVVRKIMERAGTDKDLSEEERDIFELQAIAILEESKWENPFYEHLLVSLALCRRLCAGVIVATDEQACLHYIAERRCERFYSGNYWEAGPKPKARLTDWLPSLRYFQTREDLWGPFAEVRKRDLKRGELFFRDEDEADRNYGSVRAFSILEESKHGLFAWKCAGFFGVVGAFASRSIDRFDDEAGIQAFLEDNSLNLVDDRGATST
jgi:hypothetical protein